MRGTPPNVGKSALTLTLSPRDRRARDPAARSGATAPSARHLGEGRREAPRCPTAGDLSKKRWLAERERLAARNAPLGLLIEPARSIDDIAADLPRFALIALDFPKFSDGRAFSTARLLREKHGYTGELRAVGNVLSDQIPFMRRVGFDAFEVTHAPPAARWPRAASPR